MSRPSRTDPLLLEVTRRILREVADPQTRRSRADGRAAAWRTLEDNGLAQAWTAEASGGAGASIADGFEIATLAGEFALDVPLVETLLAGWLIAAAGLSAPAGKLAPIGAAAVLAGKAGGGVAVDDRDRLHGRAAAVPFAREVDRFAVVAQRGGEPFVALVDRAACAIHPRNNLAGEPRDTVIFDGAVPSALAVAPVGLDERLLAMGAVARACQIAGALRGILDRTVAYAGERVAFDRPLAKFQVIQHALARLAGETAIALASSGSAADALAADDADAGGLLLEVASAKIRAGEAAAAGAAIAHQVHGAIGFSTEHPLHLYTQRLWAWRDDFGSESVWAVRLGSHVAAAGADALWPLVAAR
ncbi:MAG TPA: acyl-CoA dehydrogenase family protein [Kofleriaceae bacterium]|nr:acyl-CoA dehydrogenase family protein [Kofleriaceae bacterium]